MEVWLLHAENLKCLTVYKKKNFNIAITGYGLSISMGNHESAHESYGNDKRGASLNGLFAFGVTKLCFQRSDGIDLVPNYCVYPRRINWVPRLKTSNGKHLRRQSSKRRRFNQMAF